MSAGLTGRQAWGADAVAGGLPGMPRACARLSGADGGAPSAATSRSGVGQPASSIGARHGHVDRREPGPPRSPAAAACLPGCQSPLARPTAASATLAAVCEAKLHRTCDVLNLHRSAYSPTVVTTTLAETAYAILHRASGDPEVPDEVSHISRCSPRRAAPLVVGLGGQLRRSSSVAHRPGAGRSGLASVDLVENASPAPWHSGGFPRTPCLDARPAAPASAPATSREVRPAGAIHRRSRSRGSWSLTRPSGSLICHTSHITAWPPMLSAVTA